ncbi:uncharacterized protein SCODWIG_00924 [Saccharomycodes ludwigii]|uniref:BRCT domain-containing protein n=1 Tax=Saccharomycodes ludwigii TaxID=36035 RepID=A0A376B3A8_9ASCO|nr:uncharacterized protein SCODWIG_00924 [Saccharomycodes ludwigii]
MLNSSTNNKVKNQKLHNIPPLLHNIRICPTGISSVSTTKTLMKILHHMGGIYSPNLTDDVDILLICDDILTKDCFQSEKYNFIVNKRSDDIILMNYNVLTTVVYTKWLDNAFTTMVNTSSKYDIKSYLQTNFSIKPLQLFHKSIFLARINPISDSILINGNSMDQKFFIKLCRSMGYKNSINTQCYIQHSSPAEHVMLSNDIKSSRVKWAIDDGLLIIHPKWLYDCFIRNMLINPMYYDLKKNYARKWDDIGAMHVIECWNNLDHQKTEMLLGAIIKNDDNNNNILHNVPLKKKSKLPNEINSTNTHTTWDKIFENGNNKNTSLGLEKYKTLSTKNNDQLSQTQDTEHKVFTACFFICYAFSSRHLKVLTEIITKNGGDIMPYADLNTISTNNKHVFFLIPHDLELQSIPNSIFSKLCKVSSKYQKITEFYIERCLHYKKLILPTDHWSKPFLYTKNFKCKNTANNSIKISISGFQNIELLHITKILKLLTKLNVGLEFSENLNKRTNVLIVNLAALSSKSISRTNPLWYKNKYADLFQLEMNFNMDTINNNDISIVTKESLRKKLEFIKSINPIPSVTPSILFELFELIHECASVGSTNFMSKQRFKKLYLNDQRWCITYPTNNRLDNETTNINLDNNLVWFIEVGDDNNNDNDTDSNSNSNNNPSFSNTSINKSLKNKRKEVLNKFNSSKDIERHHNISKNKNITINNTIDHENIKSKARKLSKQLSGDLLDSENLSKISVANSIQDTCTNGKIVHGSNDKNSQKQNVNMPSPAKRSSSWINFVKNESPVKKIRQDLNNYSSNNFNNNNANDNDDNDNNRSLNKVGGNTNRELGIKDVTPIPTNDVSKDNKETTVCVNNGYNNKNIVQNYFEGGKEDDYDKNNINKDRSTQITYGVPVVDGGKSKNINTDNYTNGSGRLTRNQLKASLRGSTTTGV